MDINDDPEVRESRKRWLAGGSALPVVEFLDQRRAMFQNRSLIDGTFVGNLGGVDRWWNVEQQDTLDSRRAAGGFIGKLIEQSLEARSHQIVGDYVERLAREFRLFPITGRDVRPAKPGLELVARRRELYLLAGHRQTNHARAPRLPVGASRQRRGLGGSQSGNPEDAFAAGLHGEIFEHVPYRLRHRTACRHG